MKIIWSKIDWIMVPRLLLSTIMFIEGYRTNDHVAIGFGLFLAMYAILGAKYKVGCGYNACGYTPSRAKSNPGQHTDQHAKQHPEKLRYTEIK